MFAMRADRFLDEHQKAVPLTDDEVARLWPEFNEAYGDSQRNFDASVRALAAVGIAVSATLAGVFHGLGWSGDVAVVAFVVSLLLNLLSYGSAQGDMVSRLESVVKRDRAGVYGKPLDPSHDQPQRHCGHQPANRRNISRHLRYIDVVRGGDTHG